MKIEAFECDILVDGQPLEEHQIDYVGPRRAICRIESEEGKVSTRGSGLSLCQIDPR